MTRRNADPRDRFDELPAAGRVAVTTCMLFAVWAVAATLLPRGLPSGIVLLGAASGGLYGLIAVGLVLVYRSSRVVNFAQAELGSLAGVLAVYLAVQRGWNYFFAIGVGLAVGAATGALLEIFVLRRFRRAPRLIATVATIGLAQILNGISILVALRLAGGLASGSFETPFSVRFTIDPVVFVGDHVAAGVVVVAVVILLSVVLRRTEYGIALRATADSGDRARLLGIPVARLSTLVWTAAGALSALGIILRVPLTGFQSFTAISGAGSSLLLRALAAAVIGRMDRFGVALGAGVALGIVEGGAAWSYGNTAYADGVLVLVILGALLVQRTDFSRVAEGLQATASYQAIREVRPIPGELAGLPAVRFGALGLRLGVLIAAVVFPLWASPSRIELMSLVLIYALVAVSLVVLTGWAGHISLGHWALAGLGGTTATTLFSRHDVDLLLAGAGGIGVSALVAVAIGVPALRVRGPFLAVTTLAFAVTASTLLLNSRYVPWLVGERIDRPALFDRFPLETEWQLYYLVLGVLVVVVGAVGSLRRSRSGRALIALRDNAPNAAAFAVPPIKLQLVVFAVSGSLAGLAGVLYALHQGGIRQDAFDAVVGLQIFSMVVIGGLGSVSGAVLGAAFIRGAQFFLSPGLALVASGGGILFLLLVAPGGLGEVIYRVRDRLLRILAHRNDIVVPSLVADVQTAPEVARPDRADKDGPAAPGDAVLSVRGLDVGYDGVQVLFGVDLDVIDGEILALLGTNGAGKSTILRAVSGLATPSAGTVHFAHEDLTGASPGAVIAAGIVTLPGGRGVFPSLTVAEHFRIGGWSQRGDPDAIESAAVRALETFPILEERWDQPAGTLSGGEQQMLNLSLALLAKPRLLLIDELSLGLAPRIVEQLVTMVSDIHAAGTSVVIVEQSLTTALRLAERAIFLEKGEVRFTGPTNDLLERPDLLRAVFLGTAADAGVSSHPANGSMRRPAARPRNGREPLVATAKATAVLEVEDVTKRYGGIAATRGVTLSVFEHEILGMIGPNGAGKTTLFDLMSGFVTPDYGAVRLHGIDVTHWSPDRRARSGLGRSFQDARLWPSLTVAEAIAVACERHVEAPDALSALCGLPTVAESEARVTARVEELIEVMRLHAFRDKFVAELSTGSRRIVEIAAVLAHRPSVLLLDEPSSGVAQRETEALGPVLRDVRRELGCAVVVIDHDLPLVLNLVDRLAVLEQGALLRVGDPTQVMADPDVVASYMGTSASELAPAVASELDEVAP